MTENDDEKVVKHKKIKCATCGGSGVRVVGFGKDRREITCDVCDGEGEL